MATRAMKYFTALTVLCGALGFVAAASARTIGITPPHNPRHECTRSIDACRAGEGVGRLILPDNWSKLSTPAQLLTITDLERVNRGLRPVAGLIPGIDRYAQIGADNGEDPSWPSHWTAWRPLGSVEATFEGYPRASPLAADLGWMYDDGPGGENLDCSKTDHSGCWGHRDILLTTARHCDLVAGAATAHGGSRRTYTVELGCALKPQKLVFSWARELKHFRHRPRIEPLH